MLYAAWFQSRVEFAIPAAFGPGLAAIVTHRVTTGNWQAFQWFGQWQRSLIGSVAAIALISIAFVVLPALLLSENPQRLNWAIFASMSMHNYTTLLGGPLGEEPGWRGYALPRLQERFGPIAAWLILTAVWTVWHLPMFWVADWSAPPFGMYLLLMVAHCAILHFAVNIARFAVLPAILGHAAFNSAGQYFSGLFEHAAVSNSNAFWSAFDRVVEALGIGSLTISVNQVATCCGLLVALLIVAGTRGRLGYSSTR
jgi:membrane protease YdiL (CAAX protease family)